jgi:complex iron-sulfur molybdoenzyme family reductase subunit alpha
MKQTDIKRRDFLKVSSVGAAVAASQGSLFAKQAMSISDPASEYPNASYTEKMYRDEFSFIRGNKEEQGFAYHCVNCQGNCAWEVWANNGVVTRENQSARYPSINPKIPDFNPRGCNKGVQHSQVMYEKDRILYPMRRVGERGSGQWERISWDEAAQEVAEKLWDVMTDPDRGPGKLMVHAGTGLLTEGRRSAPRRFATQIGAVSIYAPSYLGDMFSGASLAYGEAGHIGCTYDFYYLNDCMILWGTNPDNTRIPDAHFIWEGKYRGGKVIAITPEFNATARHADVWIPIKSGTDSVLAMAVIDHILQNDLFATEFVKTYTDLPFLVRTDNQKMLRRSDIDGPRNEKWEEQFYFWNTREDAIALAPGTQGNEDNESIRLKDRDYHIDPALEGSWDVTLHDGSTVEVTTAFALLKERSQRFNPGRYRDSQGRDFQESTNVHPDMVKLLAEEITKEANKVATITVGFSLNKYHNGVMSMWDICSIAGLAGRQGPRGGIHTENEFRITGLEALSGFGGKYSARFGSGFVGEFMMGEQDKEFDKYFKDEDVERAYDGVISSKKEYMEILNEMVAAGKEGGEPDVSAKHWWIPDTAIIVADSKFRRNKGSKYREAFLKKTKFWAYVDYRMSEAAYYADILLPAKSHYEVHDIRTSPGYHRFANLAVPPANMKPIGEAKDEWGIFTIIAKKLQDIASRDENFDYAVVYDDERFARDGVRELDIFYDEFTNNDLDSQMDGDPILGEDPERPDVTGDRLALEVALDKCDQFAPQTPEKMYKQGGFLQLNEEAGKYSPLYSDRPYATGEFNLYQFKRFGTLSGRQTFYVDHDVWIKLGCNTPTGREGIRPERSEYPYTLMTPHARWSIHTNYKSAKLLQRLQRGKPWIMLNTKVADVKGIKDGQEVRVFNALGEFYAMAKVTANAPLDSLVMEDGWDVNFFRDQKGYNEVVPPSLSLLELADNWGHLKFSSAWDGNQYAYDGAVNVEAARK